MPARLWDSLTPQQRKAVELVAAGQSRRKVAEAVGVASHATIHNWLDTPAAIAYWQHLDKRNRGDLYSAVLNQIRERVVEWGSVPLKDLIAILKVLQPREVNVHHEWRQQAEFLASELGLEGEAKDALLADAEKIAAAEWARGQ